ncbi:sterol 26-hydroxylase, mitochondrial [Lampris incognitus]|uniref:sterol 26-hydroxylase, mitochondrial n=1 Tax=Lampris incognitus TaxID=2546036 RepID=UPI0024B51355|nr:sterol 26-hydroxylase, mitochondrial [Lampris incognitus]
MATRLVQCVVKRNSHRLLPCAPATALVYCRGAGGTSSPSVDLSRSRNEPRTIKDLPRVTLLELLYRMVFQGYSYSMHELQIYEKELYGPIYITAFKSVSLSSAKLVEEILRMDEKFPCRGDMSLWTDYRDTKGLGYGPFTEQGESWYNLRAILNKRMLHPRDSVQYGGVINEVVTDLINRIYYLRQSSSTGDLVSNLSNEMRRFSLEGISSILFEMRIGCLEKEIPADTQEFINSISQMFSNSMPLTVLPKWSHKFLPYWGRYIAGWEGIFTFAGKLIDKKMKEIEQQLEKNEDVEGRYLSHLLSNTQMAYKDVHGSIAELLLAGVDTTSNTMMWVMYQLSRNPEVQNILYEEVSRCIPNDHIPSVEEVNRMPYLKAVIKEALRLYPVVPMNARIITEKEIVIGGYRFPKRTTFTLCHYAVSHDEKTFPEPKKFKPERWLRDGRVRPNPFASIPFGFGVRGCVGRRIAEVTMYLSLVRIIRLFEIKPDPTIGEVKSINYSILVADRQVNLRFLGRKDKTFA